MDLLQYLEDYRVWVCVTCGFAVNPDHYENHLKTRHADHPKLDSKQKVRLLVMELRRKPLLDPKHTLLPVPAPDSLAIPFLPIHDGLACLQCSYVARAEVCMRKHCQEKHISGRRRRGGQPKALAAAPPRWKNVACQRFFVSGPGSGFFAVVSPAQLQEEEDARRRREMAQALPEADFVTAQVDGMLEEGLQEVDASENLILDNAAQTEVSPWLEMTRWPRYLRGYSFDEVAPLGSPADPATEPLLAEFAQSFDRIVEESHKSVCDDKVNVFDQARINSFIQRRRAWDRPLMIKLKKSTYQ